MEFSPLTCPELGASTQIYLALGVSVIFPSIYLHPKVATILKIIFAWNLSRVDNFVLTGKKNASFH